MYLAHPLHIALIYNGKKHSPAFPRPTILVAQLPSDPALASCLPSGSLGNLAVLSSGYQFLPQLLNSCCTAIVYKF
jgi:hypothetical protein